MKLLLQRQGGPEQLQNVCPNEKMSVMKPSDSQRPDSWHGGECSDLVQAALYVSTIHPWPMNAKAHLILAARWAALLLFHPHLIDLHFVWADKQRLSFGVGSPTGTRYFCSHVETWRWSCKSMLWSWLIILSRTHCWFYKCWFLGSHLGAILFLQKCEVKKRLKELRQNIQRVLGRVGEVVDKHKPVVKRAGTRGLWVVVFTRD